MCFCQGQLLWKSSNDSSTFVFAQVWALASVLWVKSRPVLRRLARKSSLCLQGNKELLKVCKNATYQATIYIVVLAFFIYLFMCGISYPSLHSFCVAIDFTRGR